VPFDITRLVNDTMLQQSQTLDSHNNETLTSIYSKWYLDVYLKRKEIVYSDHFREFANNNFDTKTKSQNIPKTEQYTDRNG
jgi:hypothetical protein